MGLMADRGTQAGGSAGGRGLPLGAGSQTLKGALLVGAWVVLVAGTPLVPARLRFSSYKRWMRTLLTLWWIAILLGVAIYYFGTS